MKPIKAGNKQPGEIITVDDIDYLVGAFVGEGDQSSDARPTHLHRYGDSVQHGSQWCDLCFNQSASH